MQNFSRPEIEEGNSEMGMEDPILEKGDDKELRALTEQFVRALPDSPRADVVGGLYNLLFRRLLKIFQRRASDRQHAEDAIQEAFVKLQSHFDQNKALPDKPLDWLFVVAGHGLIGEHRKKDRRSEVALQDQTSSTIDGLVDERKDAREPLAAVASAEVTGDMTEVGKRAYAELDKRTRKICELYKKGKSWDEIAKKVNVSSGEYARKLYEHAIAHVQAALGAHFSSCLTTAEAEVRRHINSKESARKAIELLPPPSDEILKLLLIDGKTEREVALLRDVSEDQVKFDHKRAVEHLQKAFKMTEAELLEVILHGK